MVYTLEQIMEEIKVFACQWSIVGTRFDTGDSLDEAESKLEKVRQMIGSSMK
jgi:hypothetical protein